MPFRTVLFPQDENQVLRRPKLTICNLGKLQEIEMQEHLEQTRRRRWGQQMRPIGKGYDLLWRIGKGSGMVSGGTIRGAYREGGTIRLWRIRAHFQGILPVPLVRMTRAAQLDAITIVCPFLQRTTDAN